jgi:hypothetical protein
MSKNVYWSSCKEQSFFYDLNGALISSTEFRQILKYRISRKSVLWELSCSTRTVGETDGKTDTTNLIVAFSQFCERAKI